MYLVNIWSIFGHVLSNWAQRLAWGGDLVCHAAWTPRVIIMECRVLDLAVPVCLQRTSWSVAPERLEVSRDPPAKWLNATY